MMKSFSRISTPLCNIMKGVRSKSAMVSQSMQPMASTGLCNQNGAKGAIGDIHHRSLDPKEDKEEIYKMWVGTYDADVASEEYMGPAEVAKSVTAGFMLAEGRKPLTILDAGCGTGLVGEQLRNIIGNRRHINIVGADISAEMLELAKNRGYTETHQIDMNELMEFPTHSFDAVACSGTFIQGHVHADPAIPELCRVVRPGGQVVATVRMSFYDESFQATLNGMEKQGHRVEISEFQYLRGVSALLIKITTAVTQRSLEGVGFEDNQLISE